MKVDADNFLNDVERDGKYLATFSLMEDAIPNNSNIIDVYEYVMEDKAYEILIHKKDKHYVYYYIRIK